MYVSAELGERSRIDRSIAAMAELGEVRQRLLAQWIARHGGAMLAIFDGNFATAESLAAKAHEIGRQSNGEQFEGVYGIQMFSIRREQGRLAEVAPVVKRLIADNPDETAWLPGFALIAADLGFEEPARRRLRELAETGFEMPLDAKRSASLSYVAEVASRLGETESAARIYELMSGYQTHDHHCRDRHRLLRRGEPLSRHAGGDARRVRRGAGAFRACARDERCDGRAALACPHQSGVRAPPATARREGHP